jgi:hypothetical protein
MKKSSKNHRARKPTKKKQKARLPAAAQPLHITPGPYFESAFGPDAHIFEAAARKLALDHDYNQPVPLAHEKVQQIVGASDLRRLSDYDQEYWKTLGVAFFELAIPNEEQRDDLHIRKTEDGYEGGDNNVDWVHLTSGGHHFVLAYFYDEAGDGVVELFANRDDSEAFFRTHPEIESIHLSYEAACEEARRQWA